MLEYKMSMLIYLRVVCSVRQIIILMLVLAACAGENIKFSIICETGRIDKHYNQTKASIKIDFVCISTLVTTLFSVKEL